MLDAWKKAFPGVIKPESAIPQDLLPHLRYPPVLFEAQRQILAQFHVTQAPGVLRRAELLGRAHRPERHRRPTVQPAAVLPHDGHAGPAAAGVLAGHVAHAARPAQHGRVHGGRQQPAEHGLRQIRVLQLPQDTTIRGPQQVQNDFESNATVASALTLLRQGGSQVTQGNLITLPVGGGLMYFEPVYVSQAATGSSGAYPTLQDVLAYYNGQVGFGTTLAAGAGPGVRHRARAAQPGSQPAASTSQARRRTRPC